MQFESLSEMLDMAGHGPFVWSAYGLTLAVMLWLVISPLMRSRRLLDQQRRRQLRDQQVLAQPEGYDQPAAPVVEVVEAPANTSMNSAPVSATKE